VCHQRRHISRPRENMKIRNPGTGPEKVSQKGAVVSNVTWPLRAVMFHSERLCTCQATRNLTAIWDRSLGSCPSRADSSVCNSAFDTTRCTPRALHRGAAATRQATETSDGNTAHRPASRPPSSAPSGPHSSHHITDVSHGDRSHERCEIWGDSAADAANLILCKAQTTIADC
jgi:hypothetical protein